MEERNKENTTSLYNHLAPLDEIPKSELFKALDYGLRTKEIFNIAITGSYGSGKSSFLKSYFKNRKPDEVVNISLAKFCDSNAVLVQDGSKTINQEIEKEILQQLFYRKDGRSIPFSRFKKIRNISKPRIWIYSILICFFFYFSLYISNNSLFTRLERVFFPLELQDFQSVLVLCVSWLSVIFLLKIIQSSICLINQLTINKIGFQNTEVELCPNQDSLMNNYIDEILYFFEVSHKINVVVFEDLDRFNDLGIFTKLREINQLINSYEKIRKRRIIFIYAIKDEMFVSKERVKFFDFIIPVVPVINNGNSIDKLIVYNKGLSRQAKLDISFLQDISLFIDDMRLLINIFNEYIIYSKIQEKNCGIPEKLFSLIIFKNIYPKDFAQLSLNKGLLYFLLTYKKDFITFINAEMQTEADRIEKTLEQEKNILIKDVKLLRTIYLRKIEEKIRVEHSNLDYNTLCNDHEFAKIRTNTVFNSYRSTYYSTNDINYSFSEIEKLIDPNETYQEKENRITNISRHADNTRKLNELQNCISANSKLSLKELINRYTDFSTRLMESIPEKLKEECKEELIDLLIFFLRNGYIDENYSDYVSLFYEGSISRSDHEFLLGIKNHRRLPYDFGLKNIHQIIQRIHAHEWEQYEVLNNCLLDFMLANIIKYASQVDSFFKLIINEKTHDFLKQYQYKNNVEYFVRKSAQMYPNIWDIYNELPENEKRDKFVEIMMFNDSQTLCDVVKNKNFKNYASEFQYLNTVEFNKIQKEISEKINTMKLSVSINDITGLVNDELFSSLIMNRNYVIEKDTIESILLYFKVIKNTSEIKGNYLTLIRKVDNEHLNRNISDHISEFVTVMILQTNEDIFEESDIFLEVLNSTSLDDMQKDKIITQNKVKITKLSDVTNKSLWVGLLAGNKVVATWDNILIYYENNKNRFDDSLIQYLSDLRNAKELVSDDINILITDAQKKDLLINLFTDLLGNASIPMDSYKVIFSCNRWKIDIPKQYDQEKIIYNISNNDVKFNEESFLNLRASKERIEYITTLFDEYLKTPDLFKLNPIDIEFLLRLDENDSYLVTLFINNLNTPGFPMKELQIGSIMRFINKNKVYDRLTTSTIRTLFSITNNDTRLHLLVNTLSKFSFEEVEEILIQFSPEYNEVLSDNKRKCTMPKHEITEEILKYLQGKSIISTWKYENEKVLIYLKRSKK